MADAPRRCWCGPRKEGDRLATAHVETLSVQRAAKTAAALFVACGALVALAMPLLRPLPEHGSEIGVLLLSLVALASGPVIWFLPWARWGRAATLAIIPVSLSMIALFNAFACQPYLYPVFFLVVFVWIGLFHARGMGLLSAPILALAYLAPLLRADAATSSGLRPLAVLLPVSVVLAEVVSWLAAKLRRAELARARSEARYASLVREASEFVLIAEPDGIVRYISPTVERMLGLQPSSIVGRTGASWLHPDDADSVMEWFRRARSGGEQRSKEYRVRHADGTWRWIEGTVTNLLSDPAVEGIVVNGRDVTERRAAESRIELQALHDSVTGLPNRELLLRRLEQTLGNGQPDWARAAVLFFDLDDFKLINDSHGHAEGDRVLAAVADRLRRLIHPPAVLARFGGDEFVVLCPELESGDEPFALAAAIEEAMARPLMVGTRTYHVSVSIGVSFADSQHYRPDELLRDADVAMYAAKRSGRGHTRVFDDELRWAVVRRVELEQSLWRALERSELEVHYQPEVELPNRRIRGAEALLRWRHGAHGLLEAAEFVPVAEEAGLIVPIGEWLLGRACFEAARWNDRAGHAPLTVAINVSACELVEDDLPRRIGRALADAGLEPGLLCLEITERSLMGDQRQAQRVLGALKNIGVTLALDDFGTGYSSLTCLRRFPVDRLKIDRSFVEGLGRDRGDETIVRAVVEMADGLGMEAVAEGVETPEQHDALVRLGCTRAQGLFYGRPTDSRDFDRFLEKPAPLRSIA